MSLAKMSEHLREGEAVAQRNETQCVEQWAREAEMHGDAAASRHVPVPHDMPR